MENPQAGNSSKIISAASAPEGVRWDKEPPTGPPAPPKRATPTYLDEIVRFFEGKIADEGLLLDLCLDRAMEIVKFNCDKRRVGADFFSGDPATPEHVAALSVPLAVELYKQCLQSVKDDAETYRSLLEKAQKEMERGRRAASPILVP